MNEAYPDRIMMPDPCALVGTWRRFGAVGPVCEITGIGAVSPNADRAMRVRVIESGEELDYRLAEIMRDPSEG